MYAYCRNNPVFRIDITGFADEEADLDGETKDDLFPDPMGGGGDGQPPTGTASGSSYASTYSVSESSAKGGNSGGASVNGTVTLYRAVCYEEYNSARNSQQLSAGNNSYQDGKWFATTQEDAVKWGDAMYPNGDYSVMEATFDSKILSHDGVYYTPGLDSIGPAYFMEIAVGNYYMICIN